MGSQVEGMRRARPGDWAFLDTVVSVCYDARGQRVTTLSSRGIPPLPRVEAAGTSLPIKRRRSRSARPLLSFRSC